MVVVNESHRAADASIEFEHLPAPVRLARYSLSKDAEDKAEVKLRPERTLEVRKDLSDRIPPMSIVVYSTYRLNPDDPGMITEE